MTRKKIIGTIVACVAIAAVVLLLGKDNITEQSDIQNKAAALKPGSGAITGKLMDRGRPVNTGAFILASVAPIPNPPPTIRMSKPPVPSIFSAPVGADGTYSMEVTPNTKPHYLRVFYPVEDSQGRRITNSKAASGLVVNKPGARVEQDFSWP